MDRKYDATYQFGKVVVHVIAPLPMSEEEKQRRLDEYQRAAWDAWNSLPVEERLRINVEFERNLKESKDSDEQRRAGSSSIGGE
ncbi:MAG TPA: hypothetical protein PKA10_19740 [Selenomonadales bacterium]|nr:hypothetical protein [Selenomonadales bacterium]